MKEQSLLRILRVFALLEAFSWLALLIAMYLKWVLDHTEYMRPVGNIHGYLFIFFVIFVLIVGVKMKWNFKEISLSLLSSILPFGTIVADIKIFKKYVK